MRHSKEPWILKEGRDSVNIVDIDRHAVIAFPFISGDPDLAELEKLDLLNAKRIIACVNALAGIENPEAFVKRALARSKQAFPSPVMVPRGPAPRRGPRVIGWFKQRLGVGGTLGHLSLDFKSRYRVAHSP